MKIVSTFIKQNDKHANEVYLEGTICVVLPAADFKVLYNLYSLWL